MCIICIYYAQRADDPYADRRKSFTHIQDCKKFTAFKIKINYMIYTTKDICDLQIASNCGNFCPKFNNCDYKVTLLTSGRRFKVFIGMRLNSRKILVIYIHDRIQNSNHNNICFESKSGIFFQLSHTRLYFVAKIFILQEL